MVEKVLEERIRFYSQYIGTRRDYMLDVHKKLKMIVLLLSELNEKVEYLGRKRRFF